MELREEMKRAFRGIAAAWRGWTGGRWILLKMLLSFMLLLRVWDYFGEEVLRFPEKVVDPLGVLVSAAVVYRYFLRDIKSIFYPEGAVGEGSERPKPGREGKIAETQPAKPAGGLPRQRAPSPGSCALPPFELSPASAASVLLADEDARYLQSARKTLDDAGIESVQALSDSAELLPFLSASNVAVLLLGIDFSEEARMELVHRIREEHPQLPVIVMTRTMDIEAAVACMKAGAFDYLVKPVEKNRFLSSVRRALEVRELRSEVSTLKEHLFSAPLETEISFHGIVTRNRKVQAVCRYAETIAPSQHPVLVTGETGAGKELIARAIHGLSGRAGEFVAVNVAGLDDTMFSDTLFGHRKGAYTGAGQAREGLIARASGGTLFLDEIGDLEKRSQVKLLRLLEEKEYYPLGSDSAVKSDARVVCSTHHCLPGLLSGGDFRKDLYYRLHAHHIHLPPLRERMEDLPLLVNQWLEEAARSLGKRTPTPPAELLKFLSAYQFPGNVRELRMMVLDAVAQHGGGVLSLDSFRKAMMKSHAARPSPDLNGGDAPFRFVGRFPTLREANEYLVIEALKRSEYHQGSAAILLGLSREALNKRLQRQKRMSQGEDAA